MPADSRSTSAAPSRRVARCGCPCAAAWAAGQVLTLDEAMTEALAETALEVKEASL